MLKVSMKAVQPCSATTHRHIPRASGNTRPTRVLRSMFTMCSVFVFFFLHHNYTASRLCLTVFNIMLSTRARSVNEHTPVPLCLHDHCATASPQII